VPQKKIDRLILEDIESVDHPSIFESDETHAVLIVRVPEMTDEGIDVHSYAFLMENDDIYRYSRKKRSFEKVDGFDGLHRFFDIKMDRLLSEIQLYHYDIEKLEESLYEERAPSDFMQRWLSYKKDVSLVNRLMLHALIALERFIHHFSKKSDFDDMAFSDLLEHTGRVRDLSASAMDKLDNLHDFYRAKVDEKMNRNMYWLTIISAVFLPLTLVTGFFGMNTGGLPFTEDSDGTLVVSALSIVLEIVFLLSFFIFSRGKTKRFRRTPRSGRARG
jgi:magnesium transporter